jgi:hypothetical protein
VSDRSSPVHPEEVRELEQDIAVFPYSSDSDSDDEVIHDDIVPHLHDMQPPSST